MEIDQTLLNMKILFVEDDEVTRNIVRKMLSKKAGKVIVAENGKEGLNLFIKERPDIIITDLRMPLMDGLSMIKEIRRMDLECPISIYTESDDLDIVLRSVELGIDKYWIKPLKEEDIVNSLNALAARQMIKNNEKFGASNVLSLDRQGKLEFEDQVKKAITSVLKKRTGKGPVIIQANLVGREIHISARGVLTQIEKSLSENKNNISFINFNRNLFYNQFNQEFCIAIDEATGIKVHLESVALFSDEDLEELKFSVML